MEEEQKPTRLVLEHDPDCAEDVTKVLLVYDAPGAQHDAMVTFLSRIQGYHVVQLQVRDADYVSVPDFIETFQATVTRHKRQWALVIVHYSQHAETSRCMYCNEVRPASSRLLKHALGAMYVNWGLTRCAVIHPVHCCSADSILLPAKQIEDMAITYEGDTYPDELWGALVEKLDTVRTIDSYKDETRHVRTVEDKSGPTVEHPLSADEVLQFIGRQVQGAGELARALGTPPLEWSEHAERAGEQALYLVLRRVIADDPDGGYERIAKELDNEDWARMCRDVAKGEEVFLSNYDAAELPAEEEEKEEQFVGTNGIWDEINPSDGTHIDKVDAQLLPPYMRDALELEQSGNATPAEVAKATELAIARAQELDREFEQRRVARELEEYRGTLGGGTTLLGGYATRDKQPGRSRK